MRFANSVGWLQIEEVGSHVLKADSKALGRSSGSLSIPIPDGQCKYILAVPTVSEWQRSYDRQRNISGEQLKMGLYEP